jgi:conjugal transfer pilus assembly protein TraL
VADIDYRIPRDLDALPVVLFWEVDEFIILVVSMFVGIFTKHAVITVGAAFIFVSFYKRMKKTKHKGYVMHLLYRMGLLTPKNIPPYHVKEFND